jgi:spore coat protein U-like protein
MRPGGIAGLGLGLGPGLCLLLGTGSASACSFTETGGTLTSVSSFVVRSGPAQGSTGYTQFNCTGVVLAAASGTPTISAVLSGPVSGLTLKNGTDAIPYAVTGAGNLPYTNGQTVISLNGASVVSLLTAGNARVPFNITTSFGPNVAAGVYSDTLTVLWTYQNICEGLISLANICLGTLSSASNVSRTLTVSLTVTNDCSITAPDIQFGSAPLLSSFPAVGQNIGLLCTKGLAYTVGISAGNNASGGRRQMASGSNRLQYDVFKPNATVWGATGTARATGPAAADGLTTQLMPYTARIYTDQSTPAAGTYSDSLVVDVGF